MSIHLTISCVFLRESRAILTVCNLLGEKRSKQEENELTFFVRMYWRGREERVRVVFFFLSFQT